MNYASFDASETLVQEIVDECNYLPLGYDKKLVVVDNCYFLLKSKPRNKFESEQDYKEFIKYLKNPNESSELILTILSKDVDEKSEIYKAIKENGKIMVATIPDKDSYRAYIRKYITQNLGVSIDNEAINELALRSGDDIALFQNSAKKLALYTDHITFEDVCLMVARPLEDNAFQLFKYLINNDINDALSLYRDLISANVEPISLVSTLANQFRFLNQVAYLNKSGMSVEQIAKELGVKDVRVSIAKKQIYLISENAIQKTLEDLFQLDMQIKSGLIDRLYAFELFIINFKAQ